MALRFRPHTWTILAIHETEDGNAFAETQTVRGQITPMSQSEAVNRFGLMELRSPHLGLCNVPDGELHKVGDRIRRGGKTYTVHGVVIWDAETTTSHAGLALELENAL